MCNGPECSKYFIAIFFLYFYFQMNNVYDNTDMKVIFIFFFVSFVFLCKVDAVRLIIDTIIRF